MIDPFKGTKYPYACRKVVSVTAIVGIVIGAAVAASLVRYR